MAQKTPGVERVMNICHNIAKSFEEKTIFSDFTLDLTEGITAIVGPSGCGKTTLLQMMIGIEKPNSGSIHLFRPAGVVFSNLRLIEWFSPIKNLRLTSPSSSKQRQQHILSTLEIPECTTPVNRLSSGQRQRVALARAWLFESPWLFLDEAFRSWDVALKQRLLPTLRHHWKQEKTLTLVITHDITEALMIADRILLFSFSPVQVLETLPLTIPEEERRSLSSNHPMFLSLREKIRHHFDPINFINNSQP